MLHKTIGIAPLVQQLLEFCLADAIIGLRGCDAKSQGVAAKAVQAKDLVFVIAPCQLRGENVNGLGFALQKITDIQKAVWLQGYAHLIEGKQDVLRQTLQGLYGCQGQLVVIGVNLMQGGCIDNNRIFAFDGCFDLCNERFIADPIYSPIYRRLRDFPGAAVPYRLLCLQYHRHNHHRLL